VADVVFARSCGSLGRGSSTILKARVAPPAAVFICVLSSPKDLILIFIPALLGIQIWHLIYSSTLTGLVNAMVRNPPQAVSALPLVQQFIVIAKPVVT
jgi:hypothetical protein